MEPEYSPAVRRIRLGKELRDIRETKGMTLADAAKRSDWSRGQLSRLERGEGKPDTAMVMDLMDLYGVEEKRYSELVSLARTAARTGWWNKIYRISAQQRGLAELEAGAETLRIFNPVCIPGLLQTDEYAKTRVRSSRILDTDPGDLENTVELRMQRRRAARKINLQVILDEAVLYRRVSTPEIRLQQFKSLLEDIELGRLKLQVLPFDRQTDGDVVALSPFTIFEYAPPDSPMVVVDLTVGGVHQEMDEEPVKRYQAVYDRLADAALSPDRSAAMIEALLDDI